MIPFKAADIFISLCRNCILKSDSDHVFF